MLVKKIIIESVLELLPSAKRIIVNAINNISIMRFILLQT